MPWLHVIDDVYQENGCLLQIRALGFTTGFLSCTRVAGCLWKKPSPVDPGLSRFLWSQTYGNKNNRNISSSRTSILSNEKSTFPRPHSSIMGILKFDVEGGQASYVDRDSRHFTAWIVSKYKKISIKFTRSNMFWTGLSLYSCKWAQIGALSKLVEIQFSDSFVTRWRL